MTFTSLAFWGFTAVLIAAYYLLPRRMQWALLLLASLVFYSTFSLKAIVYLLSTALIAYLFALSLNRCHSKKPPSGTRDAKKRHKRRLRLILSTALIFVVGALVFLKYYNFLAGNIGSLFNRSGNPLPYLDLLLPLGISFYTLQIAGYVIDVYRGKYPAERNPLKVMLFASFFPQMVQGPIGRYDHLAPQLFARHTFNGTRLKHGILLVLWGFFKKVLIADRLAFFVNTVFDQHPQYGGAVIFLGVVGYCFQVYADFSGGIDIVRGCAQMLGIDMAENFKRPYFATSVQGFWLRWHITLGAWMKDYVFYPLSLSKPFAKLGKASRKWLPGRVGKVVPAAAASFVVFMLIGVWHGASWKFIAYGIYNAVIITFSTLMEPMYQTWKQRFRISNTSKSWHMFALLRTFFLMTVGRYFSRALTLTAGLAMLKATFTTPIVGQLFDGTLSKLVGEDFIVVLMALAVLLVVSILQERGVSIRHSLDQQKGFIQFAVLFGLLLCLVLFGLYREGYIATEFIYAQF